MSEIQIVPMAAGHVAQVAALEQQCFSVPWSQASIAGELHNALSLWLVALREERVAGYVGSQAVLDEADVMNLAVAPDCRRQGVGRALMEELQRQLVQQGVRSLALEVRPSNQAALALYDAMGFRQVGRRPNYYVQPKEDGLILRREWEL